MSRQELKRKNYTDLSQDLNGIEGVYVQSSTGKTGRLDISIRGTPPNHLRLIPTGEHRQLQGYLS
ncbi:TonB-dependent receptor plug domain-containing protein [Salmonella enterica subsp. enterica serovar Newport]